MCPLKFNLFSSSFLMVSIPNISQNKVLNFLLTDLDIFEEKKCLSLGLDAFWLG